ncbi:unnamed protein product [Paramecium sonneborni]|uniref:Transmembrane protein n=1 Tax=Paramecium sonneborni TaxID=65129 RepID=A0A8S1KZT1_9CILI|nr:unnamed protein product [Paramecium sonneborni]
MERREDDVQYYKIDNSNEQQDKIILTLFQILMNALMGSLFFYYSTHESKYGGDQCKFLRPCALWFGIYCFFSLFASIVLNPYAIYYKHDQIFDYANIVEGSMKLVFFILFCVRIGIKLDCINNIKQLWITKGFDINIYNFQCNCIFDVMWTAIFCKAQKR